MYLSNVCGSTWPPSEVMAYLTEVDPILMDRNQCQLSYSLSTNRQIFWSLCQELWKLPSQVDRLSVCGCLHLVSILELKDAVFEHASIDDQAHQVHSAIQRSPALAQALAQAFDDLEHQV